MRMRLGMTLVYDEERDLRIFIKANRTERARKTWEG